MESRKSFCCAQSLCAHRERTEREHALTSLQSAIENLKSKMSAVPVVQRIEQGFPKAKWHFCTNSLVSSAMRKSLDSKVFNILTVIPGDQQSAYFLLPG